MYFANVFFVMSWTMAVVVNPAHASLNHPRGLIDIDDLASGETNASVGSSTNHLRRLGMSKKDSMATMSMSVMATAKPTTAPTPRPTGKPTAAPTGKPTAKPTATMTASPKSAMASLKGSTMSTSSKSTKVHNKCGGKGGKGSLSSSSKSGSKSGGTSGSSKTGSMSGSMSGSKSRRRLMMSGSGSVSKSTSGSIKSASMSGSGSHKSSKSGSMSGSMSKSGSSKGSEDECFEEPEKPTTSPLVPPTSKPTKAPTKVPTVVPTPAPTNKEPSVAPTPKPTGNRFKTAPPVDNRSGPPTDPPTKGSSSGDPHFKTWTGEKYDYHGECDLVLVDHPDFMDGLGLRVHIRTTRLKYFSFIEKIALQIGWDILEFDNDVNTFLINGKPVEPNRQHHKTVFAGFIIHRFKSAISVRLDEENNAKIDFHTRKNGFPAVFVDAGKTNLFEGSLGLLGEWGTGAKLSRNGTVMEVDNDDATQFPLEWQVRDTEPLLFQEARYPQYPNVCLPAKHMLGNRLGKAAMEKEAERVCKHWKMDMEDCMFDVIATRDVHVAAEGHIVHVE